MRNAIRIMLCAVFFLAVTSAYSLPGSSIDRNYYDANGCWQGERYIECQSNWVTVGNITGAHWLHIESWDCQTFDYSSDWYVWNGRGWSLTSDPGVGFC